MEGGACAACSAAFLGSLLPGGSPSILVQLHDELLVEVHDAVLVQLLDELLAEVHDADLVQILDELLVEVHAAVLVQLLVPGLLVQS